MSLHLTNEEIFSLAMQGKSPEREIGRRLAKKEFQSGVTAPNIIYLSLTRISPQFTEGYLEAWRQFNN